MYRIIASLFATMILSAILTPFIRLLAFKVGAVDNPNARRVNKVPMPTMGGLAIFLAFNVTNFLLLRKQYPIEQLWALLLAECIILATGIIDDIYELKPRQKIYGITLAALVVFFIAKIKMTTITLPFLGTVTLGWLSLPITLIWILAITNAVNLIDGLDGLSSGVTLISCLSLLMVFALNGSPLIAIVLITALAGALVGFLPFNFSPAKTFIGDTGSNFMGFSLAIISILGVAKTYTALVLIAPIIILGMPIFDTIFAIFRRIIKGKSIKAVFKPDKGHLHHKLMSKGYTQKQAVLIMYGITAILGMFAVILLESGIWKALSFAILIIAIVAIGYKDMSRLIADDGSKEENKIDEKHIRKQE